MSWHRPIHFDPAEGVDRKDLKTLCRRYLEVNAGRLNRTRELLSARQNRVLDVLPLLFHVNHPLLPGYVSRDTPRGVHAYEPSADDIRSAQYLCRSFNYRHDKKGPADIRALFLMGSTGSIAHGPQSDFDIWLCHRSSLGASERKKLAEKAQRVADWATSMGVDTHLFLIDAAEFRAMRKQAEANQEDCGTAQHFLLLDEFYRTHLWLAGAYPLWWIIPADHEADFNEVARTLAQKRFIRSRDYIDFGGCPDIPPAEFVGAGMWQLYKGLDAPYKSLLKLLLIETYARAGSSGEALCLEYKRQIFSGQLDLDALDPYLMVYRRLEQALSERGSDQLLELSRRAFYLKIGEPLSRNRGSTRSANWRRQLLQAVVQEWGWKTEALRFLDGRQRWRLEEVSDERRAFMNALNGAYRYLADFAASKGITSAISARDLNLLGRKLYAVFQRKAGKLDLVNPGIVKDLHEDSLAFVHISPKESDGPTVGGWALLRELPQGSLSDNPDFLALRKASSLFELLAWAHLNCLLSVETALAIQAGSTPVTVYEIQQLLQVLESALPVPLPPVSQAAYQQKARIQAATLALNVGVDPMHTLKERGLTRISNKTDPFRFGGDQVNLVHTVDLLLLNSWNEVIVQHFAASDPLIQALKALMSLLLEAEQASDDLPVLTVCCFSPTRAQTIVERVDRLWASLTLTFFEKTSDANARWIFELGKQQVVLQCVNRQPRFTAFSDRQSLLDFLAQPQARYSPLKLESNSLSGDALSAVAQTMRPESVSVYYTPFGQEFELMVVDEHGSLYYQLGHAWDVEEYLLALVLFLRSVRDRRQLRDAVAMQPGQVPEIRLFQMKPSAAGLQAVAQPLPATATIDAPQIQVLGEQIEAGRLSARACVDDSDFRLCSGDLESLEPLARYLLSRFQPGSPARAYVTDLSLPGGWADEEAGQPRQTLHYLQFRSTLQRDIENAMSRFSAVRPASKLS